MDKDCATPIQRVCLGRKLLLASSVISLPLRYNLSDYNKREMDIILRAKKVYFPTMHYAPVFAGMGKDMFPSINSYLLLGDKVRQTMLFQALGLPHPRTRFFPGRVTEDRILAHFTFPFIAKIPHASSRGMGVFLINNLQELKSYLKLTDLAYIQEYIPLDRDIRVVVLGKQVVLSYWKIGKGGNYRTNVAQGSQIVFSNIPDQVLDLALEFCQRSGVDHVGLDICISDRGPLILEANIHFGREGFEAAGISYHRLLAQEVDAGRI